jgi:hypothetical protein
MHRVSDPADVARLRHNDGPAQLPLGLTRHRGRFQYLGKPVALDADPLGKVVHASSSSGGSPR